MQQSRHSRIAMSPIGVLLLAVAICDAQLPQFQDNGPYHGQGYGFNQLPMYGSPNPGFNGYNNMGSGGYNPMGGGCPGGCPGGYNPPQMNPGGYNPMMAQGGYNPMMGQGGYPIGQGGFNPMMGPGPGGLNIQQRRSNIYTTQTDNNQYTPNDLIATSTMPTTIDTSFMDSYDKYDIEKRDADGVYGQQPNFPNYGQSSQYNGGGGPPMNSGFNQPPNYYNQQPPPPPNYAGNSQSQSGYGNGGPLLNPVYNQPPQPYAAGNSQPYPNQFGYNTNNWPQGQFNSNNGDGQGQYNQDTDTDTTTTSTTTSTTSPTSPTTTLDNSYLSYTDIDDSDSVVRGRFERNANQTKKNMSATPFPSEILGVGPVILAGSDAATTTTKTEIVGRVPAQSKPAQKSVVLLVHPVRMERSDVQPKGANDVADKNKDGEDDQARATTIRQLYNHRSSFNRPKRDDSSQTSTETTTTKEEFGSFQMVDIL